VAENVKRMDAEAGAIFSSYLSSEAFWLTHIRLTHQAFWISHTHQALTHIMLRLSHTSGLGLGSLSHLALALSHQQAYVHGFLCVCLPEFVRRGCGSGLRARLGVLWWSCSSESEDVCS
jgi:hypothetical protein